MSLLKLFRVQRMVAMTVLLVVLALSNHQYVQTFTISSLQQQVSRRTITTTRLYEEPPVRKVERGVSVDQDGKSNVWAIEPKIEIEQKSNEDKSTAALFAVGGLVVCGAAAALILTNLPDPNQF